MTRPADGQISCPSSTGGAGTFFEQHVGAFWLAQLLMRSIPPILIDCVVEEIGLQTEHLGWKTDDFLVIARTGSGAERKLLGQVKRTFTISASDEDCVKAIIDFWDDFAHPTFTGADRLVLVVLRGTNVLLENFAGLLECARSTRNGLEFERSLATPGRVNAKCITYCDAIGKIIATAKGIQLTRASLWPFLRQLDVLSLDLDSSTHQTESSITSMLAHAAQGQDAPAVATTTWNELLRLSSNGMGHARRFTRDDLPLALRQRHSVIEGPVHAVLRRLSEHSVPIINKIRPTIGQSLRLPRDQPVSLALDCLASHQAIVITGAAGSGKSCVALRALSRLAVDHFTFCFRAEEFATPHLDTTLGHIQAQATASMLQTALACQATKVVLIDSIERLLEKDTREAFNDFLGMLAGDPTWKLILTCRDYSTETVRSALLDGRGISHAPVPVPPLDDGELAEVQAAYPILARPLADPVLRAILRSPYIVDTALRIPWADGRPLPQTEQDFRDLYWKTFIRVDDRAGQGMPRRREATFVDLSLKRARSLTSFVARHGLDQEAVDLLIADSLLTQADGNEDMVAPAHDVLEDWAILRWIDRKHSEHADSLQLFAADIGPHPAIRRTYRKWVSELVAGDSAAASALLTAILRGDAGVAHFNDDTIVSLLRSSAAVQFLEAHITELLADGKRFFLRVIHLLRLACVKQRQLTNGSTATIPEGPAWAAVLAITNTHLPLFGEDDRPLLLGLIEDWARLVTWQTPYPAGASAVAGIAKALIPAFDDYRSGEQLERALKVLARIPAADAGFFTSLLRGSNEKRNGQVASVLQRLVLEGTDGYFAARDLPDDIIAAARSYILCAEGDISHDQDYYGGAFGLAPLFGLKLSRDHDFFPASAYRGPFLSLLRHHPLKSIAFIIEVFNHGAEWYAHPRVRVQYVEEPFEITLTFSEGTSQRQWCNSRMWGWYRGISVGPYVLQTLLMALERWLKEVADTEGSALDDLLISILRGSTSGALTAVVAAIATAYPHRAAETLLVLLHSPACIQIDRERFARDTLSGASALTGILPRPTAAGHFDGERSEANAWPHRAIDLEAVILQLQLGPFADRVHAIIDNHRLGMPPGDSWGEKDRLWSLALDRMDLRQYRATDLTPSETDPPANPGDGERPQKTVRLDLSISQPDVQAMVNASAEASQNLNGRLGVCLWGTKAFERQEMSPQELNEWRKHLETVRQANYPAVVEVDDYGHHGPGIIAAVCIRDHWSEMMDDEQDWCLSKVCAEIVQQCDHWGPFERMQRNTFSADRICAFVIPLLLMKSLSSAQHDIVCVTFIAALTHPVAEVRVYAANGLGSSGLWTHDRRLVIRCLNAIAFEATAAARAWSQETKKPHADRKAIGLCEAEAATFIRKEFWKDDSIPSDALHTQDLASWIGIEANRRLLAVLSYAPSEQIAVHAFALLARTFVTWWDAQARPRRGTQQPSQERSHDAEIGLSLLLASFCPKITSDDVARILQPIVEATDRHPAKVADIVELLIGAGSRHYAASHFWALWQMFADQAAKATWLPALDQEFCDGQKLLAALFLDSIEGMNGARHWSGLEGNAHHLHALYDSLPPSAVTTRAYTSFLYRIGEQSLPDAFIRLARRLRDGGPETLRGQSDTVFMLESLLERLAYRQPKELKRTIELRDGVLSLLDMLVDTGSSVAFRMRDDFVTPSLGG